MTKLVRLPQLFRIGLYPKNFYLEPVYRRIHQSAVMSKIGFNELKDKEAMKWLSELSPEMKEIKSQVELVIDELQEEDFELAEVRISPADIKFLMMETEGEYYSVRRYLRYKRTKDLGKARFIQRGQLHRQKRSQEVKEEDIHPGELGWSVYTRKNMSQLSRHIEYRQIRPFMFDALPVIFDMDYEQPIRDQIRVIQQINHCCEVNRIAPEPCRIHITGYKKNETFVQHKTVGFNNTKLTLHEDGFDKIFPLEKLVYLSPKAPQLKSHKPGDIYVLGAFTYYPLNDESIKKAYKMGIRIGSIPFKRNDFTHAMVKAKKGYSFPLNIMLSIVLDVNLRHDWSTVIRDFAQKQNRKKTKLKELKEI